MMLPQVIIIGAACLVMSLSMSDANEGCWTTSQNCIQSCLGECKDKCTHEHKHRMDDIENMNIDTQLQELQCLQQCLGREEAFRMQCYGKCEEDAKACYEKCNEDFRADSNRETKREKLIKCCG